MLEVSDADEGASLLRRRLKLCGTGSRLHPCYWRWDVMNGEIERNSWYFPLTCNVWRSSLNLYPSFIFIRSCVCICVQSWTPDFFFLAIPLSLLVLECHD